MRRELTPCRTIAYVFLLDKSWLLIYNIAPRFQAEEFHVQLVSTESCFAASSAYECWQNLRASPTAGNITATYSDMLDALCRPDIDGATVDFLARSGELTLLLLAYGESKSSHMSAALH
jgi:hypothetical protein